MGEWIADEKSPYGNAYASSVDEPQGRRLCRSFQVYGDLTPSKRDGPTVVLLPTRLTIAEAPQMGRWRLTISQGDQLSASMVIDFESYKALAVAVQQFAGDALQAGQSQELEGRKLREVIQALSRENQELNKRLGEERQYNDSLKQLRSVDAANSIPPDRELARQAIRDYRGKVPAALGIPVSEPPAPADDRVLVRPDRTYAGVGESGESPGGSAGG